MNEKALNTIKKIFQERHHKNPAYSLRAFARDAGVSASQISRLLNGTRNLTSEQFLVIARNLALPTPEPLRGKVLPGSKALKMDAFKSIAEWQHWAILNLTFVEGFRPSPLWISRRLGISVHLVKESVQRLLEMGLLEKKNNTLVKVNRNQVIQTQRSEEAVRLYHHQMISKASEALKDPSQVAYSRRTILGQTFAISEPGLRRIQKKMSELQEEVLKAASSCTHSEVYQLNLQLFPLTKIVLQTEATVLKTTALKNTALKNRKQEKKI